MTAVIPLLSALVAGCVHALEMDHLTAVTTFVARCPHPLRAFGFGVRWALGHSMAILIAGGALLALGLRPPQVLVSLLELAVGFMLVGLGGWVIAGVREPRGSTPTGYPHAEGEPHAHRHGTTWVGAAHGLAGTTGFLALIPATMLGSPVLAGAYLALFGVGTMVAMGLYAAGAGLVFHRVGGGAPRVALLLRTGAGLASVAVGVAWLLGAV